MLSDFTVVANAIAATTEKNEKERLLADYLRTLDDASLERTVVFFSGSPFPRRDERVTGVGGAIISDAAAAVTGRSSDAIWASWSKHGAAREERRARKREDDSLSSLRVHACATGGRSAGDRGGVRRRCVRGRQIRWHPRAASQRWKRSPNLLANPGQRDASVP